MKMTQETALSVCRDIVRSLPAPHDQYDIVTYSDDGYGSWTITNSSEDVDRGFVVKETVGEDVTAIGVVFHSDYLALVTMLMGRKHRGQGCESKIIDLLLEKSKEIRMPLVVVEVDEEFDSLVEGKELKESVTRIDTTTAYSVLKIFVISEPDLQKEHEAVAKEIREFYLHRPEEHIKAEHDALQNYKAPITPVAPL